MIFVYKIETRGEQTNPENRKRTKMTLTKRDIQTILSVWHGTYDHREQDQREQAALTYDAIRAFACSDGGFGYQQPVTLKNKGAE